MSHLKLSKATFFAAAAITFSIVMLGQMNSEKHEALAVVDWAYQGSVTACFEQKAVANEIEISRTAIERATRKVMGFVHEIMPEDEASPEVCGRKLA